jgi:hypothetical protein
VAFALCSINLYAYYKCRNDFKKKLSSMNISSGMQDLILSQVKNRLGFN